MIMPKANVAQHHHIPYWGSCDWGSGWFAWALPWYAGLLDTNMWIHVSVAQNTGARGRLSKTTQYKGVRVLVE